MLLLFNMWNFLLVAQTIMVVDIEFPSSIVEFKKKIYILKAYLSGLDPLRNT